MATPASRPWWVDDRPAEGSAAATREADALAAALGLVPHPEGGRYRETYRAPTPARGRAAASQILFLLQAGERSRWHRLDADEIWHFYQGVPLALSIAPAAGEIRTVVLGTDLAGGQQPHAVVPAGAWQTAEPVGDGWSLLGCTVAPGFEFAGFELAPDGWRPPVRATR